MHGDADEVRDAARCTNWRAGTSQPADRPGQCQPRPAPAARGSRLSRRRRAPHETTWRTATRRTQTTTARARRERARTAPRPARASHVKITGLAGAPRVQEHHREGRHDCQIRQEQHAVAGTCWPPPASIAKSAPTSNQARVRSSSESSARAARRNTPAKASAARTPSAARILPALGTIIDSSEGMQSKRRGKVHGETARQQLEVGARLRDRIDVAPRAAHAEAEALCTWPHTRRTARPKEPARVSEATAVHDARSARRQRRSRTPRARSRRRTAKAPRRRATRS